MKEHDDDVLPTVKESTATVDSTPADETVTVRGKIEGLFGERDEGEDMVVDVVGADVAVDDRGGTKADSEGKVGINGLIEEGSKREIESTDMDMDVDKVVTVEEVRVVNSEKVEVVVSDEGVKTSVEVSKDVIEENVVTTTVTEVRDNNEIVEQHTESAQELIDKTTEKESDVSSSLNFPESGSRDAHVAAVKEGLFGKDEGEDAVDNHVSSTDAVISETNEDTVHVSTESIDQQPGVDQTKTVEVATTDVQDSENVTQPMESVQEMPDEVQDSTKIPDLETKADVAVVEESLSVKDEVPKDPTDNPNVEEGLTESVQESADVDLKKEDVLDSTKIPESVSKVDEVAVEEGDKSQDVTQSVNPVKEENVEVDMEKEEDTCSNSTIEVKTDDNNQQKETISSIQEPLPVDDMAVDQKPEEVDQPPKHEIPVEPQIMNNVDPTTHPDYGEDAGMDIDEVLGWKDEIPGIGVGIGIGIDHDPPKPLVYERRVHVSDDIDDPTDFCRQQETEPETQSALTDDVSEVTTNPEASNSISFNQLSYFHPPPQEGDFSPSDLVWGKVRSHPWWPGQIFDQSDASDKAMKYHKKDRFLVAYFGDRSFAWNDSTVLKPFRSKFPQIEKNTNSESFNNALDCALQEVSRRIELGLACKHTPSDIYEKIECQIVENAGVKKESSKRHGNDKTALVGSFEPDKLLDYVRLLAKNPYNGNDGLDLVMAKAQLVSCARFKGFRQLSEFQFCGTLLEDNSLLTNNRKVVDQVVVKKERGLLVDVEEEEGSRKRKLSSDSVSNSDVGEKRPALESVNPSPKPSFKVGELIQRVANQLSDKNTEPVDPLNPVNLPDMLSQLHLTAQDPMKGYGFLNTIIPFFYSHRAAVFSKSLKQTSGRINNNESKKRKPSNENDPEDFEFDDVNDSYWTDRIIQNHPEDLQMQPSQPMQVHGTQNGGAEHQIVAYEEKEKPVKQSRRSNKKRFFSSNHEIEAKEQSELMERRRLNLATEVLMKFTQGVYFPSEIHLNKMFRRFGPLLESETEVDRQGGRARVVFKKCSDAEVAHSSAGNRYLFQSHMNNNNNPQTRVNLW
ncbi:hypothetical protein LXL04_022005 [Taraxacum kok-saghyz]